MFAKTSQLGQKRKLTVTSIVDKYKILKEIYKGNSLSSTAVKYGTPKQTVSNWIKKKKEIYVAIDFNLSTCPFDNWDKLILFVNVLLTEKFG